MGFQYQNLQDFIKIIRALIRDIFLNYNDVVLRYGSRAPPLITLRTWAGKVQKSESLEGDGTNSVLSRKEEETILKFIKELKYEVAVIDLDTIAALGRTVAETSRGPGPAPVLDRQWAANFRRRHKMGCLKKITTERLLSTVSHLALDNNVDVNSWTSLSSLKSMVCVSLRVNRSRCQRGRSLAWTRRPSSTRPSCVEGMQLEKNT